MDKIFDTSVKYLTDIGADRQEAESFVKDLCDKVPAFYGKFCIGVLRWIMEEEDLTLEPYCIRELKNRWYLYAHKGSDAEPHMFALDRMLSAEVGEKSFKMPSKFNPAEYFSGVYGVRVYPDMKPEFVTLKTTAMQANYFRSLPLHSSQEEIERTEEPSNKQI